MKILVLGGSGYLGWPIIFNWRRVLNYFIGFLKERMLGEASFSGEVWFIDFPDDYKLSNHQVCWGGYI